MSWFSNLLPAIENAANNIKNAPGQFVQGITSQPDYNKYPDSAGVDPNSPQPQQAGTLLSGLDPVSPGGATHAVQTAAPQAAHALPAIAAMGAMEMKKAKPVADVVSKVVAPDAAKSLFGLEHTQNIQDALVRHGVTDYNNIGQKAKEIYEKTINPILTTSPKLINIDDITTNIVNEMRKMKPGLDPRLAKQAAHGVINDMYNVARGTNGEPIIPTHIDTPGVFNLRQDLNSTNAVKDFFDGIRPQNLEDIATVASRKGLSNVIQTAHPTIADATKDYGLLQDAVPSIYKATQQAAKDAANATPPDPMSYIPGSPLLGKGLNKLGNKILTNPTGQKVLGGSALVGGGALGTAVLPNIVSDFNKNRQSYAGQPDGGGQQDKGGIHDGIITQPFSSIKPDSDGSYSLPQSAPNGQNQRHYMSAQEYNDQLAQIGQQHTFGTPQYNQAKTQLDAQHAQDQQQADEVFKGNNIKNFMDNATTYNSDGNQLISTFNSLPTGFWNGVSKAGSLRAYNDPNYASQLQQIDSFNNEFASAYQAVTGKEPTSNQLLSSANSLKQATTKYIAMMQFISGTYGKYVNPYLALTSGTGKQTSTGTPTNATSKNLPTIQNTDTSGIYSAPVPMRGADAGLPAIQ